MLDLGGVEIKELNTIRSAQVFELVGTFVHSFTQVAAILRSEIVRWLHCETENVSLPSKEACTNQLRGGFIVAAIPKLMLEELDDETVAEEVAVDLDVDANEIRQIADWRTLADALAVITSMFTKLIQCKTVYLGLLATEKEDAARFAAFVGGLCYGDQIFTRMVTASQLVVIRLPE